MIHIRCLDDTHVLTSDPELWREVFGYLSVCVAEFLEYADAEAMVEHDFNFMVVAEEDLPAVEELGLPEECVRIDILSASEVRCLYRVVYTTEVLFIPGELASRLPFPLPVP